VVTALSAMVLLGGRPVGGPVVGWVADLAGPCAAIAIGSVTVLAAGVLTVRRLGDNPHDPTERYASREDRVGFINPKDTR
jgi:hypothetical protein